MIHRVLPVLLSCLAIACGGEPPGGDPEVPVHVGVVALDEHDLPVVILEESEGSRWLPIWIGAAEAHSIAVALEQTPLPRPNTHDLASQLILGLAGELSRVVVTELRAGTYFATLTVDTPDGPVTLDSRPSDAIALALRARAPIFVRASLLDPRIDERPLARPERRI
jgi:bifunctional DNase/RNase